jgi:metaxin
MFPEDRLSSFLPNVQNLHEDLSQDIKLFHTPKTSAELGSHLVLNQFLPAWDIQAYVRFAGINLHTMNSRYPATMSTGEHK